jgi:hypothetical protein
MSRKDPMTAYVTYFVAVLMAFLPTVIVASSMGYVVARRKLMLAQDFTAANSDNSPQFNYFVMSRGGMKAIQDQIESYMKEGIWLPSIVLLALNVAGFVLATEFLRGDVSGASLSVTYTFIGAYVFNLGLIVRRLSFSDLNVQMLWRAIYRLVLATSVGLVLNAVPRLSGQPSVFFAIGFLSNVFLEVILTGAQKLADVTQKKRNDGMSLQMVRGIDYWKAQRLEEEGIEDVQNLATADVLELAVRTHYNLQTLLDWIDQAVVVVRFREKTCELENAGLNISAIDMAWASPRHRNTTSIADAIAKTLGMDPALIAAQMDGLHEDQYVKNLWTLWQTRPGYDASTEFTPHTARAVDGAMPS